MRHFSLVVCRAAGVVLAGLLLLPVTVRADFRSVDCTGSDPGKFLTIQAAINSLPVNSPTEPHTIFVIGPCVEIVNINSRQRITIQPSSVTGSVIVESPVVGGQPVGPVFNINGSRSIILDRLTIRGGRQGVRVGRDSDVSIRNCTIENNLGDGVNAGPAAIVSVEGTTIQNNSGPGLRANTNSTAIIGGGRPEQAVVIRGNGGPGIAGDDSFFSVTGTTVENNPGSAVNISGGRFVANGGPAANVFRGNGSGLNLVSGMVANLNGSNTIENNGVVGIQVSSSFLGIGGGVGPDGVPRITRIEGHSSLGINIVATTSVNISGPHVIQNNSGPTVDPIFRSGIRVASLSRLTLGGDVQINFNGGPGILADTNSHLAAGAATINNNAEEAIRIVHESVGTLNGPITATGNGGVQLSCDTTALVHGLLDGIKQANCPRIERQHGPPRPGALIQ